MKVSNIFTLVISAMINFSVFSTAYAGDVLVEIPYMDRVSCKILDGSNTEKVNDWNEYCEQFFATIEDTKDFVNNIRFYDYAGREIVSERNRESVTSAVQRFSNQITEINSKIPSFQASVMQNSAGLLMWIQLKGMMTRLHMASTHIPTVYVLTRTLTQDVR